MNITILVKNFQTAANLKKRISRANFALLFKVEWVVFFDQMADFLGVIFGC